MNPETLRQMTQRWLANWSKTNLWNRVGFTFVLLGGLAYVILVFTTPEVDFNTPISVTKQRASLLVVIAGLLLNLISVLRRKA